MALRPAPHTGGDQRKDVGGPPAVRVRLVALEEARRRRTSSSSRGGRGGQGGASRSLRNKTA